MKQKISITSSTSLLGLEIINTLEKKNFLLNLSTKKKIHNYKGKSKIYLGDLKNRKFVNTFIGSSSCLINLAYDNTNYENYKN